MMDEKRAAHDTPFDVGSVLELRKPHPCGSVRWVVYRTGADIGLRCQGCGRCVMLTRRALIKQLKRRINEPPLS